MNTVSYGLLCDNTHEILSFVNAFTQASPCSSPLSTSNFVSPPKLANCFEKSSIFFALSSPSREPIVEYTGVFATFFGFTLRAEPDAMRPSGK